MSAPHARVAIVGAGFSGLGMAIRLRHAGVEDFVVLERGDSVGGTWRENTYPGCQCDVPSHLYSFSFAPNPDWSRTYSHQGEIWEYLRDCAERFGVTPRIRLGCEVEEAAWDDDAAVWRISTSRGPLTADVLVAGIGPLHVPKLPDIPGLERFEGKVFHSAEWNHDHDLTGKRVAVIGTGASAIQFVPRIQPKVGRLHLFQRTPPWVLPHSDRPTTRLERWTYRRFPAVQRAVRRGIYWSREFVVPGFLRNGGLLKFLALSARRHLRRQVRDPELRRKLRPTYALGCKRVLLSNNYYPSLTQPNVEVVDGGATEVREGSVVGADGTEREVDTIILGTGFHVTDMPGSERVRGRDGRSLADVWRGSPRAYLGTTIGGFPNLFMLLGPNTGLGHNSVVYMVEAQIAHVMRCLRAMEAGGAASIEVRGEAQERFNREVQARMPGTVWMSGGCASWYVDATGRNSTIWPDFTWRFRERARRFRYDDYLLRPAPVAGGPEASGNGARPAAKPAVDQRKVLPSPR